MKSPFQIIIVTVSLAAFVIAIAAFSGLFSSGTSTTTTSAEPTGQVVVWGTVSYENMQKYLSDFNAAGNTYTINYEEHKTETFYSDLITALAEAKQPDVLLFPSELLVQLRPKLYTIPFTAYSERTFRDTMIDGAQVFLSADGISALPIVVDPLVVFYNKDILATQNFTAPPTSWTTMQQLTPVFMRRDPKTSAILQSAIGLGGFANVLHARDIISALFLQTGNAITQRDPVSGTTTVTIAQGKQVSAVDALPTSQALEFYTSFTNPLNRNYSWNSSLDDTLQFFLAGKMAFYIGRASELFTIQSQNPNLNFDVVPLFQPEGAIRPLTYGSFLSVGIVKNAPNFTAAYAAATALSSKDTTDVFSKTLSLPPVRRDLLQVVPSNPYVGIFFKAALSTFTWLDPNAATTETIFRAMITSITSGAKNADTAINDAARDLQNIIR